MSGVRCRSTNGTPVGGTPLPARANGARANGAPVPMEHVPMELAIPEVRGLEERRSRLGLHHC